MDDPKIREPQPDIISCFAPSSYNTAKDSPKKCAYENCPCYSSSEGFFIFENKIWHLNCYIKFVIKDECAKFFKKDSNDNASDNENSRPDETPSA